ncbi:MAG: SPOR domain-containing protein [Bacteroidales bacterium]
MASDDGFREIQLSGKQLVFLFMATTIVAVVIFLCGVMVGRGVKGPAAAAAATEAPAAPTPDAQPLADSPAAAKGDGAAPGGAPAPPTDTAARAPAADSSYDAQLQGGKAPDDAAKKPAADEPPPPVPDAPPPKDPATPAVTPAASGEPGGDGWVVQVAALAEQAQANAIAARLVSKGYSAYVTVPPPGGSMFRVRIGKFKERREADTVMRRLQKEEEQYKPWITR